MGKGGYRGGSTLVGPQSGWFTIGEKKQRPINKFVALGDSLAEKRREERENWNRDERVVELISADEMKSIFGRKKKSASLGSSVGLPSVPTKRELRQAAKRRRLGIED